VDSEVNINDLANRKQPYELAALECIPRGLLYMY